MMYDTYTHRLLGLVATCAVTLNTLVLNINTHDGKSPLSQVSEVGANSNFVLEIHMINEHSCHKERTLSNHQRHTYLGKGGGRSETKEI